MSHQNQPSASAIADLQETPFGFAEDEKARLLWRRESDNYCVFPQPDSARDKI
jgi:hypothetical protein